MSGVLALVSLDGRLVPRELAQAQIDAIRHRGDGEPTLWLGEGVSLGQAFRPTTPEAEREELPLVDPSGRYHLVWDGRIDNREELARAFGWEGERAREATDADYVMAAYVRWGDACVTHILGDWAIVIWDSMACRLFAAKDPIGSRPLFFVRQAGLMGVATEPEQFFAGGLVRPVANQDFVLRHIGDALQEPNRTWYTGIGRLEGGQTLATGPSQPLTLNRYWAAPRPRTILARTPEDHVEEFEALFADVMRAQLRTAGPTGVLLSGGIDSSYVAAVAQRQGARPLALHYYVEGVDRFDERRYARTVTQALGLDLVELDAGECWTYSSRWLGDSDFDMPHHPPQGAGQRMLYVEAAARGIRTVFDGLGGDELFNARESYLAETLLRGHPLKAYRLAAQSPVERHPLVQMARSVYQDAMPMALRRRLLAAQGKHAETLPWPTVQVRPDWVSFFEFAGQPRAWERQRHLDHWWIVWNRYIANEQTWRDRREARLGLDRRSPLLDLRVVEFASAIPPWILRYQGRRKDILRSALARLSFPTIARRQDWGLYDALVHIGIREREPARVRAAVDRVVAFPGVREARARREVADMIEIGHRFFAPSVNLVSTGLWLRQLDSLPLAPTDVSEPLSVAG